MSLKEDVKELEDNINEIAEDKEKHAFAYDLLQDAKKTIRGLEVANILLIIALIIAIIF